VGRDVVKAHENVRHPRMVRSSEGAGVRRAAISAWVREIRNVRTLFRFSNGVQTGPVRRTRSIFQGGPSAPFIFYVVLEKIATTMIRFCTWHTFGLDLEDGIDNVCILLFAYIWWIIAKDPNEVGKMLEMWLGLLREAGFATPEDSIVWGVYAT
jgi:hypothetical protein